jgi:hypothetical protein
MYVIKEELDHTKEKFAQIFQIFLSDTDPEQSFRIRIRPSKKFRLRPDPDPDPQGHNNAQKLLNPTISSWLIIL